MGLTTDPNDPRLGRGVGGTGMNEVYLVLSEEERAKGFVRPVVQTYVHARDLGGCGVVTHMGLALSETYARQPNFYGATYCVSCQTHKRVGEDGEFYWCDSDGRPLTDDLSTERKLWKVGT